MQLEIKKFKNDDLYTVFTKNNKTYVAICYKDYITDIPTVDIFPSDSEGNILVYYSELQIKYDNVNEENLIKTVELFKKS